MSRSMPTLSLQAFQEARRDQAEGQGRILTPFDHAVGTAVYQAVSLAMEDVHLDRREKAFRVVSAPTGAGKTSSAAAVIAAAFKTLPDFTCAYVVETIRQADETGGEIARMIGERNVTVWSSGHDAAAGEEARKEIMAEHGALLRPASYRRDLKAARVIVCTHALWKREMASGRQGGVRFCNGERRSVVFVDEHPSLVKLIEQTPGDLLKLRDTVYQEDPEHPFVTALEEIVGRANEAFKSQGQTYAPIELVSCDQADLFASPGSMRQFTDRGLTEADTAAQAAAMEDTCRFLAAAARGCVFVSRKGRSLVAWEVEYEPGPGHVLLDATADITGMTALMKGMEHVDVPPVNFANLDVLHIDQPKAYRYVSDVVEKARTARPYADWIRETVRANTQPGEDVLLVTHKKMLDHDYLPRAEDPMVPLDWEGRRVNVIHWGIGVGSNKYKDKETVFLFSEFHVPRKNAIANAHGWTERSAQEMDLDHANRPLEPGGDYLTAYEGHLLRWTKQLACRGRVRNIDGEGNCGRMKLFTSMDFRRLARALPVMFPGAKPPVLLTPSKAAGKTSKVEALCRLLGSTQESLLWSDRVEQETGIPARNLSKVIKESRLLQSTMGVYRWSLRTAKELGCPGKRKALAKLEAIPEAA